MGHRDLVKIFSNLLDKFKIPYLLTGSLAVSYYGYPRATHDVDFVVEIKNINLSNFWRFLKTLDKSYIFNKGEIKQAIANSSQFNLYHPGTGIKIDFWIIGKNEFEQNKFRRQKIILIDKQKVNLVSAEDLLLTKLLWCKKIESERHLRDCAGIWQVQENKLDKKYLNLWVKKLGVVKLFEEIKTANYF